MGTHTYTHPTLPFKEAKHNWWMSVNFPDLPEYLAMKRKKGEVLIDSGESLGSHSIPKDECCLGSVLVEDSD